MQRAGCAIFLAGLAAAYQTQHLGWYLGGFGAAYAAGLLPSALFPPVFKVFYDLYCTHTIGKRLSAILHPRSALPHSFYLNGVRLLPSSTNNGETDWQRFAELRDQPGSVLVIPVPMFTDNYSYVCLSSSSDHCIVVDPGDASSVLKMIVHTRRKFQRPFQISEVLCTHKHWDHAGGNAELLSIAGKPLDDTGLRLPESEQRDPWMLPPLVSRSLEVIAPIKDAVHGATRLVIHAETLLVGNGKMQVNVAEAPGHTVGHVIYALSAFDDSATAPNEVCQAIFVGDVLFRGGCGAFFEATSSRDALITQDLFWGHFVQHTASGQFVPEDFAFVYAAHEYSERLCTEFCEAMTRKEAEALNVENPSLILALRKNLEQIKDLRKMQKKGDVVKLPLCTMPSTLLCERATNPLLTLRREVLVDLVKNEQKHKFTSEALEKAVYLSIERRDLD